MHRHALAWQVMFFMGLQSLIYYATLSWLPTILRYRGESAAGAGDLLALMGVGNLAVSLIVPVAAQRMRAQHALVIPTVLAVAAGLAGLVYAPLGGAVAWALILGAGQNAALALAIFFTAARSPHPAAARASGGCLAVRPKSDEADKTIFLRPQDAGGALSFSPARSTDGAARG